MLQMLLHLDSHGIKRFWLNSDFLIPAGSSPAVSLTPRQRWSYSDWASRLISCQSAHTPSFNSFPVSDTDLQMPHRHDWRPRSCRSMICSFYSGAAVLVSQHSEKMSSWLRARMCHFNNYTETFNITGLQPKPGAAGGVICVTHSVNHFSLIKNWPIRKLHLHHCELHLTCLSSEVGLEVIYFAGCRNFCTASLQLQIGKHQIIPVICWHANPDPYFLLKLCRECGGRVHPRLQMQTADCCPDACLTNTVCINKHHVIHAFINNLLDESFKPLFKKWLKLHIIVQ